jgi:hypothetical protein
MSTPVINAIDNVNQTSLNNLFASVATNPTARDNLSRSNRNIDKVATNVPIIEQLNTNEDAIIRILCRREGRDPSNFSDLTSVAADQSLMQGIAARQTSSKILARSEKAITAAAASQTAMQEIAASQTAMEEVGAAALPFNAVATSSTARTEIESSQTAIDALNGLTTSFSNGDTTSSGDFDPVGPLTNSNGVWAETATTSSSDSDGTPEHRLNVRGDGSGVSNPNSTTNQFVFDVDHTANDSGGTANTNTSGQRLRP